MERSELALRTTAENAELLETIAKAEDELLRLRAERYAQKERTIFENRPDAVVFRRGDGCYAAFCTDLRTIRPLRRLCRIPGASPIVPGVFYYRGEILSVHDLGCYLTPRELTETPPWVLLLEYQNERFGLLADVIIDIMAVEREKLKPLPVTFGERGEGFFGVLDGGALLINPPRLLANAAFLSAF